MILKPRTHLPIHLYGLIYSPAVLETYCTRFAQKAGQLAFLPAQEFIDYDKGSQIKGTPP
ncbi:MAG: hypothetical protein DLM72_08375 [Candidatus Nitrosopolaris wilkensis]|nr:MAG: hypothetical protein DLM72_08375 [Candidatus Nitrosopolaris wilkensis]